MRSSSLFSRHSAPVAPMNPTRSGQNQFKERRSLKRRVTEVTVRATIALGALLLLFAFSNLLKPEPSERALPTPPVLRIGVVPDVAPEQLRIQYTDLCQYLSQTLAIPYELILPGSYQELLDRFQAGEIDLALFGGYTFALANRMNTAVPLVMREADRNFTSVFITSSGHSGTNLSDYRGARFAFGSKLSTSGYLMPRIHLIEQIQSTHASNQFKASIQSELNPIYLPIEIATPAGMIVCELITNIFKYAFPDQHPGEATIRLLADNETIRIIVSDNGVGLPLDIDTENPTSFGWRLICALRNQLNATTRIGRNNGTSVTLTFPAPPQPSPSAPPSADSSVRLRTQTIATTPATR